MCVCVCVFLFLFQFTFSFLTLLLPPVLQPPVTAVPHVSDESSADNDSSQRNFDCHQDIMLSGRRTTTAPAPIEFASSVSFDPIPLQVPCPQVIHTPIQPISMFGSTSNAGIMNSTVLLNMGNLGGTMTKVTAAADSVLDDAVDELFNNSDPVEDVTNLNEIWDASAFGDLNEIDRVQNDTQLGYLLERFIQES